VRVQVLLRLFPLILLASRSLAGQVRPTDHLERLLEDLSNAP
jgi:hypothetical protein